jgi:hypothetical protein
MGSFKVTRISEGPVKPASATPDETLPLAWVDRYPTHRGLVESMHIFRSGADAAPGVIRGALAKALDYFYPLAGRIAEEADQPGAPAIRCTADGVYFAEAAADCSLEDVRYLERPLMLPKEDLVPYPGDDSWGVEPHNTIMMMQVTICYSDSVKRKKERNETLHHASRVRVLKFCLASIHCLRVNCEWG